MSSSAGQSIPGGKTVSRIEQEKPALLIIDMVKDYFDESKNAPITSLAKPIIEPINRLSSFFRHHGWPVVFSTDAFEENHFFFKSRMKPHAISGTPGAEVIDALDRSPEDYWLPKPKMSAFFQTGLESWLRERDVSFCAVAGIATPFCVLSTVLDAVCHDFKAVVLEDCCMAGSREIHERTLAIYRRNLLYPLLRVMPSLDLVSELT
jgi:nicotinamidase/pyrazinamidase